MTDWHTSPEYEPQPPSDAITSHHHIIIIIIIIIIETFAMRLLQLKTNASATYAVVVKWIKATVTRPNRHYMLS